MFEEIWEDKILLNSMVREVFPQCYTLGLFGQTQGRH